MDFSNVYPETKPVDIIGKGQYFYLVLINMWGQILAYDDLFLISLNSAEKFYENQTPHFEAPIFEAPLLCYNQVVNTIVTIFVL